MTLTPFAVAFAACLLTTVGLGVYRKWGLAMREDDYVHLDEAEGRLIPQQVAINHTIHSVDVWGKTLTVVTAVSGVVLAVLWAYRELGRY
jgi:hypothetical protein